MQAVCSHVNQWYNAPMNASNPSIVLRPACDADDIFLLELFSAQSPLLAWLNPEDPATRSLIASQAAAQQRTWQDRFGSDGHRIVCVDDTPIGRLWTAQLGDDEVRLVDISLLPAWRGRGLGTRLLRDLQAEAATEGRTVVLHVTPDNPARNLYGRLGFSETGGDGMYLRMEWSPPVSPHGDRGDTADVSKR